MNQPVRVFLLDDHEVVRRGIRDLLEAEDDVSVVGEAGTVAEAHRGVAETGPDVAILDARLPDGSGIELCRDLRAEQPGLAVIILTSFDDDDALFAAIMAGAAGYALKQIRGTDLVAAVRTVARGLSLLAPAVTAQVLERIRHGEGAPDDPFAALTAQERRILALIGEGMTNRQIAGELFLAEKTVKNYVSQLLAKLGLERRTQAAVLAEKHGMSRERR